MRKAITIAALLALLAVPFWAVAAQGNGPPGDSICHSLGNGEWEAIPPAATPGHEGHKDDFFINNDNPDCPPEEEPEICSPEDRKLETEVVNGEWSSWELNANNLLERTRTVTTTILEVSKTDGTVCFRGVPKVVVETETKDPPIELFNNCNRWVVKQGNVELDKDKWTLPFELETAQSSFWEGVISEPKRCLQIPEEPTPTPEPEPTATPGPGDCNTEGDGICPGDDDDPEEHPATGGEIDAGLAVVTALSGLALSGIGGSILFMKRRASR